MRYNVAGGGITCPEVFAYVCARLALACQTTPTWSHVMVEQSRHVNTCLSIQCYTKEQSLLAVKQWNGRHLRLVSSWRGRQRDELELGAAHTVRDAITCPTRAQRDALAPCTAGLLDFRTLRYNRTSSQLGYVAFTTPTLFTRRPPRRTVASHHLQSPHVRLSQTQSRRRRCR